MPLVAAYMHKSISTHMRLNTHRNPDMRAFHNCVAATGAISQGDNALQRQVPSHRATLRCRQAQLSIVVVEELNVAIL